jgi:cytochrome oxidase Cu insertion factor (SCO1/SenC/PrrC family)
MARSARLIAVAVLLAGVRLATPTDATDLDVLMQEFRVTPSGLKPAPAFTLRNLDGKTTALAEHRGRSVLVYFWATW